MLFSPGQQYVCIHPECEGRARKFKDVSKINRHIANHFPERAYVCVFCPHTRNDATDMHRHVTTHTIGKFITVLCLFFGYV